MTQHVHSVAELAAQVARDPALQQEMRADPVAALQAVAKAPLESDVVIYRMVVGVLGTVVLAAVAAAIAFAAYGKEIPQLLTALGSASIGALAGLLAPPPSARR